MQRRSLYLLAGSMAAIALTGCPVTDDYYLLPSEPTGQGGGASETGKGAMAGSGTPPPGGRPAQAGSDTGGSAGSSTGVGGGAEGGGAGAGESGASNEAGAGGAAPEPCVPQNERCNGHDDDCNDVIDEFACPSNCSGFVLPGEPERGYMYCTSSRQANWANAKTSCENEDMRLAWIESDVENQALATKLEDLGSDAEILIGATDQGNEGDWLWFGGEQFWDGSDEGYAVDDRFNAWADGTPNNSNNEDCVLLIVTTSTWGDRTCNATYPYVCEEPE